MPPFDPLVERWFSREVGPPTPLQRRAWEAIAGGAHALVTAPTGSGKTLAAFLWALDRLASGAWPAGSARVLYISPLRALNNDIRENLLGPLDGLRRELAAEDRPWPGLRVDVRSADTTAAERRAQMRRPAEILITTPESLAILLQSADGRRIMNGLRTVILDEIHAVAASRRGVSLMASVERVTLLAGEVQRIALSATVRPVEGVAAFVGGFLPDGSPRPVQVISDPSAKKVRLSVRAAWPREPGATFWDTLAEQLRGPIRSNRSTLVFANSRRTAEKLARILNEKEQRPIAYSHHGSLSRELRRVVEQRMKAGELPAIVATSSLELGIDVGALDEVVLVQTPPSVSSALQRIGRAGHRIGEASRARLYPLFGRDLLEAAAMAEAVREQDIEEIRVPESPLDVAAQVILAMCAVETWQADELYGFLRRCAPFRDLSVAAWRSVLEMLQGRVGPRRVRALPIRLIADETEGTLRAADGVASLVRASGGTIPDRGLFALRLEGSDAKIGDLDEEFVWERKVGEAFTLGAQSWVIRRIDEQSVTVAAAPERAGFSPFWKAEAGGREFRFASRVGALLERLNSGLDDPAEAEALAQTMGGGREAADALLSLLRLQRQVTGCDLPHRRHILLERVADPAGVERPGRPSGVTSISVLHTFWGGRVNRTLALVLADALEERLGARVTVYHDEAAVAIGMPAGMLSFGVEDLLALARPEEVERRLAARLLASGLFGARFREAAQVALLLPRPGPGRRMPLWISRLRARRLLEAVRDAGAFSLVSEALRACLAQDCDPPALRQLLQELQAGEIRVSEAFTARASPFASGLVWQQTNTLLYQDDTPWRAPEASIYREVIESSDLRPALDPGLVADFEQRLLRLAPGYAPADARELEDWAAERLLIPWTEWERLLAACERDSGQPRARMLAAAGPRLAVLEAGRERFVAARRSVPRLRRTLGPALSFAPLQPGEPEIPLLRTASAAGEEDFLALIEELIAFSGPFPPEGLAAVAALGGWTADETVARLLERDCVVVGALVRGGAADLACDRRNLERLLALARTRARPSLAPLPAAKLPLFVAARQGLARGPAAAPHSRQPRQELAAALDPLFGCPLPARMWETLVLPARVPGYRPADLDSLLAETDLIWLGAGKGRVTFCLEGERWLWSRAKPQAASLFPDPAARYGFWDLAARTGLGSVELTRRLWALAWDGLATTDGFAAVRRAAAVGFEAETAAEPAGDGPGEAVPRPGPVRRGRRVGFARWLASRPAAGTWRSLPPAEPPADALAEAERDDELVYQILDRYGIVFRGLLAAEMPHLRWGRLFRRLRVLELAGEVVGGAFFEGIEGPQFVSPTALNMLREGLARQEQALFWMSAADPASLCGVRVAGLELPRRCPGTLLVYCGSRLVVSARRDCREVDVLVGADDPDLGRALDALRALGEREVEPVRRLRVERINGARPDAGPYRQRFRAAGFRDEGRFLVLRPGSIADRR